MQLHEGLDVGPMQWRIQDFGIGGDSLDRGGGSLDRGPGQMAQPSVDGN